MCMTAALAAHGTTILATDMRHGGMYTDGRTEYSDHGGKIARSPAGLWVTGTGDAVLLNAVCAALHALDAPSPESIAATIAQAVADAVPGVVAQYPAAEPEKLCIHVATSGWIGSFAFDGGIVGAGIGADRYTITYPPEIEDGAARTELVGVYLQAVPDLFATVRRIAREFADVAKLAGSVSPVIEVAIGDDFVRDRAGNLACASAAEIRSRFIAAPVGPIDTLAHWIAT